MILDVGYDSSGVVHNPRKKRTFALGERNPKASSSQATNSLVAALLLFDNPCW
jgi:hypothetical protein